MELFSRIYEEAVARSGGADELAVRMPAPKTEKELRHASDAWYLSTMSRRIFRAGLKHSMVDAKWPAFEELFHGFDVQRVSAMSDEELESLMDEKRIIRHWRKIQSVRSNAAALHELTEDGQRFGDFLASWPITEIIGLWYDLKKRFTQLGGNSAPYFLRMAGKDTFLLTQDVVRGLNQWGAFSGTPGNRKELASIQGSFNQWKEQSQRPLSQISMVLALSAN